jgi:hypothetical protein
MAWNELDGLFGLFVGSNLRFGASNRGVQGMRQPVFVFSDTVTKENVTLWLFNIAMENHHSY